MPCSGDAMVLGKRPVPGVLLNPITVRQGPTALTVGGVVWTFFSRLLFRFSFSLVSQIAGRARVHDPM